MSDEMDEIVAEFLVESVESLDRLDRDLLTLERDPRSPEVLAGIFRTMHTIKGTCGFLGFGRLERVAHAAESLLAALRDGSLTLTPTVAGSLLATGDALRAMLAEIEATGVDGDDDHDALVDELERLRKGGTAEAVVEAPAPRTPAVVPAGAVAPDASVRVDVALLDGLMTTVGQLVLARNRLAELVGEDAAPELQTAAQRMSAITAELQRSVMETRMQPIATAWAKFPRVVRDLAMTLGKQVRIETEGGETELDRSIVEAIKDPLTHLVRNAVDHGIETPEVRSAAGKPEEGVLRVRAWHEGGQVGIEVTDDGDGIRGDALLQRAVTQGFVSLQQARAMSERDVLDVIFAPGFTTSSEVTNVSGRGIGMDVVKANVERVGGSVEIQTEPGRGTTFKIRIPLTLAIVSAFLVHAGRERYAIPQVNLLELVHVERGAIELLHDAPVIRHRGRILPLVDLARELGEPVVVFGRDDAEAVPVVVLSAEDRRFGLVVERVGDPSEVVVKPLGALLTGHELFAGATILGDGRVAMILDVVGLARGAGVSDGAGSAPARGDAAPQQRRAGLLLCAHPTGRIAVPLRIVERLVDRPRLVGSLSLADEDRFLPFGDRSIPLVEIGDLLGERRAVDRPMGGEPAEEPRQVLIVRDGSRIVGVAVSRAIDVVEEPLELQPASRPGVRGTIVVDGRPTEVLDLPALLASHGGAAPAVEAVG
ncbi:MAG TPA: chemotaxis protein CheA [Actinomycetota bacterium]|nr:chemotaxis protein CheA [Actinomycetota bacterium]